jgi:arginyl-tRNA synthetase
MKPEALQTRLRKLIKHEYGVDVNPELHAADSQHGDFSSNVAFLVAKSAGQTPIQVAESLAAKLAGPEVAGVAAAEPGFLNISVHTSYWLEELAELRHSYGRSDRGKGQKVQVEFISANPTGPLTLGNGRGGYWGDVLANVLGWTGHQVSREYYINDAGNQVEILKESVIIKVAEMLKVKLASAEPGYLGQYIEEIADQVARSIKSSQKLTPREIEQLVNQFGVLDHILEWIKASVDHMGINFDVWFSELKLHKSGAVDQVIMELKAGKHIYEKDGSLWLRLGGERDRVLVKQDGSYTYLAVDLAYHYDKFVKRGFTKVINLWGADHGGQLPSLVGGVEKLGIAGQLDIILFQLVRLIREGSEVKVSKRAGTYVTIDQLLEQVEPDVARFFFIMRTNDTHMDFDLDLAKEQSQKNPYYYVMYSYVRCQSIIHKAHSQGIRSAQPTDLVEVEKALVKKLLEWPHLLEQISRDYGVHRLTFYGQELASIFHDFYESAPILAAKNPQQASQRLALVQIYGELMEAYFKVLGIKPLAKM